MANMIGDVQVSRVHETDLVMRLPEWLPAYDRGALTEIIGELPPNCVDMEREEVTLDVGSWVLRRGATTVLIDTCIGNHRDRLGAPGLHRLDTPYLQRLKDLGVEPEGVDYVMCTHLHVDHVGWNTRLADNRWVPTFPNARYVIARHELAAAQAELKHAGPMQQFLTNVYTDSVLPIEEAGLIQLIDGEDELPLGLRVRHAPGHSVAHVRFDLGTPDALAVFSGDIIHSAIQGPLWQWSTCYCHDQAQAAHTRRDLLELCADAGALLFPAHLKPPHTARVTRAGDRFRLVPGA